MPSGPLYNSIRLSLIVAKNRTVVIFNLVYIPCLIFLQLQEKKSKVLKQWGLDDKPLNVKACNSAQLKLPPHMQMFSFNGYLRLKQCKCPPRYATDIGIAKTSIYSAHLVNNWAAQVNQA